MQKLGKKPPDHLQKSALTFNDRIYWEKSANTEKIGQSCTLFSKPGFVRAFTRSRTQCIRLFLALVRSDHSHRWCEHVRPELWVSERQKRLTEGSLTNM